MSENLAGVTLLAFGNGSPDIFASLSHSSGDTEIIYTELIGAAIFVTGFIAGVVILIKPFHVVWRNYLRDVLFFIVAVFVIDYCIHDQGYTLIEGILTVSIYIAYLVCVIVDHIRVKRQIEKYRKISEVLANEEILKKAEDLEEATEIKIHNRKDSSIILDEEIVKVFQQKFGAKPNDNLFTRFAKSLNPIEAESWHKSGVLMKILLVLKVSSA